MTVALFDLGRSERRPALIGGETMALFDLGRSERRPALIGG
jgi:hypothetical protein